MPLDGRPGMAANFCLGETREHPVTVAPSYSGLGVRQTMRTIRVIMAVAAALPLLAACGDKEPSKLTFEQVGGELGKGDDSFRAYLKTLSNRKIDWSGTVVQVRRWFEDDYMKAAGVTVDLDGKDGVDAFVHITVGDADRLKAGARVGFVAEITGSRIESERLVVELHAQSLKL